ncbi:alpha/beta fold hydrolase [Catellatospora vulcania]|uniref:alpha/beta fold hydrolase n=1 Tax=Catellatospora vulcania TaxID=1460450 RepID=UPI0012D4ADF4|nr:alpha/beta fold hydrolase [Catellatospora vulcania]
MGDVVAYRMDSVPVRGGELRVGVWGEDGPVIVAVHGITSSHLAWTLIGPELGRDHRVVAVDLRGRGGSRDLPGPYGMAAHAADIAEVVRAYADSPVPLLGHSMGGFVVAETARRFPELVERLILVDGGAPLPLPPGIDASAGPAALEQAIATTVGAVFARLNMTFPDRAEYLALWRQHPSFDPWPEGADAYLDYDLVGEEPHLRAACLMEAAARDGQDLYALPGATPAALPRPAVFLRAPRGMFDDPDSPLYAPGRAGEWLPDVVESDVPDVNHYTITLGRAGAEAVAAAVRAATHHAP